ncbi:hypothetical protein BOTBODRAFT_157552 [Botryobasidium botryosum FD-172 SS1]|uniref:Mitochondrial import inner membrane translocase subunit n=1 Tax=Botryobasidium botryosum (strain FD-172 SS1) TaxID=930990 RepID=A0A067MWC3_BOTB1|nr:hypothetical protein BOTBODRAFT_157552 [Botryobasidium botryosum FD-172 SS1]
MSDFLKGGLSSAPSASVDMAAKKQAIMDQVKNEIAMANAQELINVGNDRCYDKCITKPSTSLSSSDETCLSRCMERYMEAFNIVSRTYIARVTRERQNATGSSAEFL